MKYLYLFILVVVARPTCKDENAGPCDNGVPARIIDLTGLDGCGLVIELKSGERLEPLNLNEYTVDVVPANIFVSYEEVTEMAGICMVGKMVSINCLEYR